MTTSPPSFLIIQTAFIGDVILATALIEKLKKSYPQASVDFLLRKGNETLLLGHPKIREVVIWDKKKGKLKNLLKISTYVRSKQYDFVVNAHRFASSGLITAFSGAKVKSGFDKNPWSFLFTHRVEHDLTSNLHETERNQKLIEFLTDKDCERPRLYPASRDVKNIEPYRIENYVCIAPTSVWFTKQLPADQWISLIDSLREKVDRIYLLGASGDRSVCDSIKLLSKHKRVVNLAGQLSFLESAALMKDARMNFVNDSAPMHLASAINAPVTAIFCSTVPSFGFGPLSDKSLVVQTSEKLPCRPCGLHGYKKCPQGHFKCASTISVQAMAASLS